MNFQKLFDDYKIEWTNAVSRGWTNVNCPYHEHHNDITFKGGFNDLGDYYHCWICGPHPLHETLSKLLNVPKSAVPEIIEPRPSWAYLEAILRNAEKAKTFDLDEFFKAESAYIANRSKSDNAPMISYTYLDRYNGVDWPDGR